MLLLINVKVMINNGMGNEDNFCGSIVVPVWLLKKKKLEDDSLEILLLEGLEDYTRSKAGRKSHAGNADESTTIRRLEALK
ncbi:hypothetical protein L6452_27946 [Arctium lappa]|uniref:Uncharacterized protein n=1 Tax=Arctium lappa TaxID=4217 RepID=A0ACB8ZXZ5_ARCLA|nr:hypothetical protein L6452_27946 [Arctium lappa]